MTNALEIDLRLRKGRAKPAATGPKPTFSQQTNTNFLPSTVSDRQRQTAESLLWKTRVVRTEPSE